ncbi:arylsulfatase B-like isoform X1 [Haliotis asinina]|uniref:arylsulfatase B-like isoform X1 n=1 Tax=Haliotis asinina TaxID=109174 RepID=UPI00353222FE
MAKGCFFLLLLCAFIVTVISSPKGAAPPNYIFIVADDLGWNDVGFRNPEMRTPNLDRLAHEGVILNSSYVQPVCSPSRNCFMSGYFPYRTGLQDGVINVEQPKFLPLNFTTLPEELNQLGYVSHIVGKWHLGYCNWNYTPTYRGFESFLGYYSGEEDYYTHYRADAFQYNGLDFRMDKEPLKTYRGDYSAHIFAERAIDIIRSHNHNQSLFLYLPFQSVHQPLQVPGKYEARCGHIQDLHRRIYCGMVNALDEAVGNITDALVETGLMENLLMVFTTDNGGPTYIAANNLPLRGAKTTLWEGGTKGTAFIYSKNLLKKKGYLNTEMMHAVDWYPTLIQIAGGDLSKIIDRDGVGQEDMLLNGGPSKRDGFVYNFYSGERDRNASAIRYGHLKLIEGSPGKYNDWTPLPKLGQKSSLMEQDEDFPPYMLFNISSDPTEHFDLSAKYPDLVEEMKVKLEEWRKRGVPAQDPPKDPKSNPANFGGVWSPGWC